MIKGVKKADTVSVYDPKVNAYHEVSVEELRKQLESLGFDEATIKARIVALRAASAEKED